ncbi:MAG: FKBP-type peptidyl-prolyl cis-trans isomerase [Candidatus Nanopelagicales bacterium]
MSRSLFAALLLVPVLAVAGCGSDAGTTDSPSSPAASASAVLSTDGVTVSGEPGSEPTISIDTAAQAPSELVVKEIEPGTGKAIKPNSLVTVQYVGSAWSTGQVFQSSWATGELEFPIKGVIPGWQQGLQGAKQGARVLLIIPPEQAYGANPPPGSGIEANDTLVFVVDVVKVSS